MRPTPTTATYSAPSLVPVSALIALIPPSLSARFPILAGFLVPVRLPAQILAEPSELPRQRITQKRQQHLDLRIAGIGLLQMCKLRRHRRGVLKKQPPRRLQRLKLLGREVAPLQPVLIDAAHDDR